MDLSKKYYFISGMPRSGSTLLCNILNQNPNFKSTGTSPLVNLANRIKDFWQSSPEARATRTSDDLLKILKYSFEELYDSFEQNIIFDKSRGWTASFELLKQILGNNPKLIITIRDIPSILSSCEKLFRKELQNKDSKAKFGDNMSTIENRLSHWTSSDQIVGSCYNNIRDCVKRGNKASLHFVNFDDLTSNPKETLQKIYEFLGEEYFEHDFNNINQTISENDSEYGFLDLHTIKPKVESIKKDFKDILGDAAKPYLQYTYDFI